jgi:PTS system maltose and glucose-specific IIC component
LQSGSGVQVIYGPQVTVIKSEIEEIFTKRNK